MRKSEGLRFASVRRESGAARRRQKLPSTPCNLTQEARAVPSLLVHLVRVAAEKNHLHGLPEGLALLLGVALT